jgi:hypothetical protein
MAPRRQPITCANVGNKREWKYFFATAGGGMKNAKCKMKNDSCCSRYITKANRIKLEVTDQNVSKPF